MSLGDAGMMRRCRRPEVGRIKNIIFDGMNRIHKIEEVILHILLILSEEVRWKDGEFIRQLVENRFVGSRECVRAHAAQRA